jgi:two-component system LytT family response regulator
MKPIRTLIIEDEEPARKILTHYLQDYPQIQIVGECGDGFEGLRTIQEVKPDLIFLDVQMPKLTGFELLEVLDEKPLIIFTTAYDQYAIKAFEMNAIDYLLKPFPQDRLRVALQKVQDKMKDGDRVSPGVENISRQENLPEKTLNRVVARKGNAVIIIPVETITWLEAMDDYVQIHHEKGKVLKKQTMKFFEQHLPPGEFARIHRSCIVRLDEIKQLEPWDKESHLAILRNGEQLKCSKAGYKLLKEKLSI